MTLPLPSVPTSTVSPVFGRVRMDTSMNVTMQPTRIPVEYQVLAVDMEAR